MLARQEWYDAELRHTGILVHAEDSRRHMIVCFLFRRLLAVIASIFFFGQLIMLIIISIKKQASDPTPVSLSIWMRTSQISCALLIIIIQIYHWKALMGVAALHDAEIDVDEEEQKRDHLSNMENGKSEQIEKDPLEYEDSRELSYSEIVTGDRSNCGYTSHQQRTETYLIGQIDDDDYDDNDGNKDETKTDAEEQGNVIRRGVDDTKRRPTIEAGKRHLLMLSSRADDVGKGSAGCNEVSLRPSSQNDLASLLSESHHAQLSAPHYPLVTDHIAWIVVMAVCVCFLITSIPASLRSYVSAFILYSLTSRILEIIAASLLLSPFKIQNSSLRRRLAAKIMESSALCSSVSLATTALCAGEISHVIKSGERGSKERKKRGRYSEVHSDNNSASSLTVSIMHRPPQASTTERECHLAHSKQKKIESDITGNIKSKRGERSAVDISQGQPMKLQGEDVEKRKAHQLEIAADCISPNFCQQENKDGRNTVKEELANEVGSAWVDRWAKNVKASSHRRSDSTYGPSVVNMAAIPSMTAGRMSSTSSVTAATGAIIVQQKYNDNMKGSQSKGPLLSGSPTLSTSLNAQQCEEKRLGSVLSQDSKKSSRDFSNWSKKIPAPMRDSQQVSASSSSAVQEKFQEQVDQRPIVMDSPRSVANISDPTSPLTTSIISTQKSKVINVASSPISCLVSLTNTRPQIESGRAKGTGSISIDTKRDSKGTKESQSSHRHEHNSHPSQPQNNYFEEWVNQSQNRSKLTRRSLRINYDDSSPRSPMSPSTPDVNFYDGDGERERYRRGRSGTVRDPSQKNPPSQPTSISSAARTGTKHSLGNPQLAKHTDSLSLGSHTRSLSVEEKEHQMIQNPKGTLIATTGDLRYFLKKT